MLSASVKRAVLYGIVLWVTGFVLWGTAAASYLLLYRMYIPPTSYQTVPVHFDYGLRSAYGAGNSGALAIMRIEPLLPVNDQYEMTLDLRLPRVTKNMDAGNFMIYSLFLESIDKAVTELPSRLHPELRLQKGSAFALRALSMPVNSALVDTINSLIRLPLHVTGLLSQSVHIRTHLTTLPSNKYKYVMLELDSTVTIEKSTLSWTPQWSGLRYILSHYKILSFFICTSIFWSIELVFTILMAMKLVKLFDIDGLNKIAPFQWPASSQSSLKASPPPAPLIEPSLDLLDSLGPDPQIKSHEPEPAGNLTPAPSPHPTSFLDSDNDYDTASHNSLFSSDERQPTTAPTDIDPNSGDAEKSAI